MSNNTISPGKIEGIVWGMFCGFFATIYGLIMTASSKSEKDTYFWKDFVRSTFIGWALGFILWFFFIPAGCVACVGASASVNKLHTMVAPKSCKTMYDCPDIQKCVEGYCKTP